MPTITEKVAAFRRLHRPGEPFIIANAWDAGSARILQGLGAKALATTSSGFALTLGRKDYGVAREEALAHCRLVAEPPVFRRIGPPTLAELQTLVERLAERIGRAL